MKKYFSLLFLLIYSYQLNAQVFHTKKTSIDENLTFTFEDSEGNYISCGRTTPFDDFSGNNLNGILYKLSQNGISYKKKIISSNNNSINLTHGLEINNGYLFFGAQKGNNGLWHIYLLKTNFEFEIINEKIIGEPYQISCSVVKAFLSGSEIIMAITGIYSVSPTWIQNTSIYKINADLDSLTSIKYSNPNINNNSDIFSLLKTSQGFKATSPIPFTEPQTVVAGVYITNFDNTFNIISSSKISTFIPNNSTNGILNQCGDLHWLNDSIYVMGIQGSYWQEPFDFTKSGNDVVTLYINSKNDSILYYNILGKKDSSDLANYINVSVANENTVYCGGTHRMSSNAYMYDKEVSWLMVNKQAFYGSGVTTEWEYFYGGDARYRHTHVLATRDGGCLITARRYDTSGVFLSDAFFLKIQEDGTPYPVGGINKIKKSIAITLSPNPANDIITATFSENTYKEIGIINLQGETIFKQELQNNLSLFKINTNSFASGTYSIYFKEKETGFGIAKKIVIQH